MMTSRSRIPALTIAGAVLALCRPALAVQDADFRFDTTRELAAVCAEPASAAEYPVAHQACRAFIEATLQYHDQVSKSKEMKRLVCYPANTTIDDAATAFSAWALAKAADAKLMGEAPVVGVIRALAAKYPCKGH